jgi:superfamily II DNA or RNA helicase
MSALALRPYQADAITSVHKAFGDGARRVAVVLPTGSGKTVIFAHLAGQWAEDRGRVVILVDRDELVGQTLDKLSQVAPGVEIGVIKAERNDLTAQITVASVQTLSRSSRIAEYIIQDQWWKLDNRSEPLVIVDECDLSASASYQRVLNGLGCFDGTARALGVTATLARADGAGLGRTWEQVAYRRDILDMIPEFLVDVTGRLITVDGLTLDDARMTGGDFQPASLTEILTSTGAAGIAAAGYLEHARTEPHIRPGIVFVPSLACADLFTDAFNDAGISAAKVWGEQDRDDRRATVAAFRDGTGADVLINCMALTRGFDAPRAEVCMIARPTCSPVLYQQMIGRVLRPFPGKESALVLDVVGASRDHRLATLIDLSTRRIKEVWPGETLTEAAIRERRERNPLLADYVIDYRDIELFQRSRARWLQTDLGVWFLPIDSAMIFLWPDAGDTYRIGIRDIRGRAGGRFVADGLDLSLAMSWAEQEAAKITEGRGADIVSVGASWRSKRPSPGTIKYAESLGCSTSGNSGQVSDRISRTLASRALDSGILGTR